jgi:hypothetical protein
MHLPMGLQLPFNMMGLAGALAGFALPKIIVSQVSSFLPSLGSNPLITFALRAASVLVPGMLLRKYVGGNFATAYMVIGMGLLIKDIVVYFMPSMGVYLGQTSQPMLGYYPGGKIVGMGSYLNRRARQVAVTTTPVLTGVPDRLNPGSRF